jgi:formate dehydrogenase subunit gamma
MLVLLAGLLLAFHCGAAEPQDSSHSPIMVPNPSSDLWRAVRQRDVDETGKTQVRGVDSNVMINSGGEDFRNFRRESLIGNSAIVIGAFAAAIAAFYLARGCIGIPEGRSGRRIRRFQDLDRIVHWATAILFLSQALTGLVLFFGRFALLPLIGQEAFSIVAGLGLDIHNILGPLFMVALVMLFVRFVAKNLPTRHDITWLMKGGGAIGEGHASAGFFNAGEKIWFWTVLVLGLVVSISGLILYFPNFGQGRDIMQLALIVHSISAVLFFTGSLAHVYIGTIGSEGSLESMTTGYVDENWAKAHHDLWHAEVIARGEEPAGTEGARSQIPPAAVSGHAQASKT